MTTSIAMEFGDSSTTNELWDHHKNNNMLHQSSSNLLTKPRATLSQARYWIINIKVELGQIELILGCMIGIPCLIVCINQRNSFSY